MRVKNKIAAGVTAIALLLGFGGAASAVIVADPEIQMMGTVFDSNDTVDFYVANVLVGCRVTTTLNGRTINSTATATADGSDAADVGEISDDIKGRNGLVSTPSNQRCPATAPRTLESLTLS